MTAATRLPAPFGRLIDRSKTVRFTFEGRSFDGFAGDTIASALTANGQWVLSRSFKYHRPRGPFSMAGQEANTIVQVGDEPNVLADRRAAENGMTVRACNVLGTIWNDRGRWLENFSRFMPVGFYYRTFFTPRIAWKFWEPVIRHLAGLGKVNVNGHHGYYDKQYLFADVAIVGGGPAGLAAALAAAETGAEVVLVDETPTLGGALTYARFDADGKMAGAELDRLVKQVEAHSQITVLTDAICQGWFTDNWLPIVQGNRMFKLRAASVVIATGAMEQPLVFRNNDLPGIIQGSAAQRLMRLYGIKPGNRAVVATANNDGYGVALDLLDAGVEVAAVVDLRGAVPAAWAPDSAKARGVRIVTNHTIYEATGADERVASVRLAPITGQGTVGAVGESIACDLVCVSVGYVPNAALLAHAGAQLVPDSATAMPTLKACPEGLFAAGSVSGTWSLESVLADGRRAGLAGAVYAGKQAEVPPAVEPDAKGLTYPWPIFAHPEGKEFVEFDEDLQFKDIENAVRMGWEHIQLLKRFSTASMGPSQGRLFNAIVQKIAGKTRGESFPLVGTTTVRPPIGGETMGHLAGRAFEQVRLTPMHRRHLASGASMMPAGLWMRPAYYGSEKQIPEEVRAVREGIGLIDVSTLGKLEIRGPDAAEFLERMYTWNYAKLPVGKIRYLLMLDQTGVIIDDGVAARLHDDHYYVTATTGGVDRVYRLMQWFNAQWRLKVDIANVTAAYCGVNLVGPKAREVLAKLCGDVDLAPDAFPYLGFRQGTVGGIPARLLRIGFGGELGYEIHVPAGHGEALWDKLVEAGAPHGVRPVGIEAQRILRLEKGHIIVGQDTDGLTHPKEAAMEWAVGRKKPFFVGKPAMDALEAKPQTRRLVGFTIKNPGVAPKENHLVIDDGQIAGRVTSVTNSPTLGKVIGLAFLPPEKAQVGGSFTIRIEEGRLIDAEVIPFPFYDPENKRQEM